MRGASAGVAAAVVVVIVARRDRLRPRLRGHAAARSSLRSVVYALAARPRPCLSARGCWLCCSAAGVVEVALAAARPAAIVSRLDGQARGAGLDRLSRSARLSFGGGLVIIPLMQHDVVHSHHWLTEPAVRRCRRPRPAHARPGRADGQRRRLRRRGRGRRGARRRSRVRAVVRRSSSSERRSSTSCAHRPGPRAFLDGAGPAAVGRDLRRRRPARAAGLARSGGSRS